MNIEELEGAVRATSTLYERIQRTTEMRGGEMMIGAEGSAINILVYGSFFG
jgi:hypothetical protein